MKKGDITHEHKRLLVYRIKMSIAVIIVHIMQ